MEENNNNLKKKRSRYDDISRNPSSDIDISSDSIGTANGTDDDAILNNGVIIESVETSLLPSAKLGNTDELFNFVYRENSSDRDLEDVHTDKAAKNKSIDSNDDSVITKLSSSFEKSASVNSTNSSSSAGGGDIIDVVDIINKSEVSTNKTIDLVSSTDSIDNVLSTEK